MKLGWQRPGSRPGLYALGFATIAVTGFGLAAANEWWWPGLVLMALAVATLLFMLYDVQRKG
jgi:hypothetical protein